MLVRQVGAGQQGLSFAKEAYRVGIELIELLEPAVEPSGYAGFDLPVDPCGNPEVGVGVLAVKENQYLRRIYRGQLYVFPEPLLYLQRSLSLGRQVYVSTHESVSCASIDLIPRISQGYSKKYRAHNSGENPRGLGATDRRSKKSSEPDG